jgi:hypothetical protein
MHHHTRVRLRAGSDAISPVGSGGLADLDRARLAIAGEVARACASSCRWKREKTVTNCLRRTHDGRDGIVDVVDYAKIGGYIYLSWWSTKLVVDAGDGARTACVSRQFGILW